MNLSDFNYHLPEELIAVKPLAKRDESRLLIFGGKNIKDKIFNELPDFLKENDILVFNDTKVIPARMEGSCGNSKVEITLLKKEKSGEEIWEVLAKPAKKLIKGEKFLITENFYAEILAKKESSEVILKFNKQGKEFFELLYKYGSMPLPPYIEKKRKADESDKKTYQTNFANKEKEGSVAAPTAGLHFTDELFSKIRAKGADITFVTLHVGGGTFLPVRVENIKEHKMHSEYYEISEQAAEKINHAKKKGGRIIAVGTTSLRTLESVADRNGNLKAQTGETEIFIYPGYEFKIVEGLITNFHLPKSTLFILVSAFMGTENMKHLYDHAIAEEYRFFSYGDGSFLIRDKIVP